MPVLPIRNKEQEKTTTMPLYQQIILVAPKQGLDKVQEVFKNYVLTVLRNGGVVRAIENHGIRPLPERTMR